MKSYSNADKNISYTYNADGLRTTKTYNGVTSKYFYVNGQLHYEERSDGTQLHFYYDSYGYLSCIKYNGGNYFVATNKRGDVVALYYPGGKIMGRYEYDAWGNITKITDYSYDAAGNLTTTDLTNNPNSRDLLVVNPIRYRGYYYDVETGLYYLQSRYYNAEIGRFLNADGYITTGQGVLSYNMFAYCMNNPVMYSDPSGCFLIGFAICAVGLIIGTSLVGATALAVNTIIEHSQNKANEKLINKEVQKSYTKDEAKTEIDNILSNYGNSNITFKDDGAEILNSYLVDSKYDRQKISMIISRTDNLTNREYDNISAEWNYHNVMYSFDFKGDWYSGIKGMAVDAKMDYLGDPRTFKVAIPTKIFEALGWD